MMKQATSLKRVLNVEVKNSWGNELVYPLDETGKLLVKLANESVYPNEVKILKQLNGVCTQTDKLL